MIKRNPSGTVFKRMVSKSLLVPVFSTMLALSAMTPVVESGSIRGRLRSDTEHHGARFLRKGSESSDEEDDKSEKYKKGGKDTKGKEENKMMSTKKDTKGKKTKGGKKGKKTKASQYKDDDSGEENAIANDGSMTLPPLNPDSEDDSDSTMIESGGSAPSQPEPTNNPSDYPSVVPSGSPTTIPTSGPSFEPSQLIFSEGDGDTYDNEPSNGVPSSPPPDEPTTTTPNSDSDKGTPSQPSPTNDDTEPSSPTQTSPTNDSPGEPAPSPTPVTGTNNEPTDASQETPSTADPLSLPDIYDEDFSPSDGRGCQVGESGSFGSTASEAREVQFFFEIETIPSVTEDTVNDALLPLLEHAIAKCLLPLFFTNCNQVSAPAREETGERCEAQGFSGLPVDRVLDGASCIGTRDDPSNNCFVVDAGASLHFEADSACVDAASQTRMGIKNAIESGSFNDLDTRIVKVMYVEESDLDFSSVNNVASGNGSANGNDSRLPVYAWALIGLAAVAVLIMVGVVWQRRRRKSHDERNGYLAYGVDISCEPSISDNNWYDEDSQLSEQSRGMAIADDDALLPKMESQEDDEQDTALVPKVETVTSQDSDEVALPPKVETVKSRDDDDESVEDFPTCGEQLSLEDYVVDNQDVAPLSEIQFVPGMQDTSGEDTSDDEQSSSDETERHVN